MTESNSMHRYKAMPEYDNQESSKDWAKTTNPTELIRKVIATNIRSIAVSRAIGLNALADRANVSRSQFFNVLRQTSSPSLDWVAKVAQALKVAPAVLLVPNGEAYSPIPPPGTSSTAHPVFESASFTTPPNDSLQ